MRDRSLRVWLLFVSLSFAVIVLGGFALTTYVVVSEGMRVVARDAAIRVANTTATHVAETGIEAEQEAQSQGTPEAVAAVSAREIMLSRLPGFIEASGLTSAEYMLSGKRSGYLWSSTGAPLEHAGQDDHRRALRTGEVTLTVKREGDFVRGLIYRADLGDLLVHAPVRLPGGEEGVLDVVYRPDAEEGVIDAIRAPMSALAILTMLVMIVLMQASMAWVLSMVSELRKAADSIEAGRLDARLPEQGTHEVGQLARSVNRLIDRLQRRADAQSRFIADASHELATPVAGIRGYTSILRAWGGEDAAVREEAVDAIDRESARMTRLTSDLLNLLHVDEGLRFRRERFDLNVLARERLAATASRYLDRDIEFIGPEEESLEMVGDPDRLEDVLSILLDNAGKYTPPGGRVTLATKRVRDMVHISVSDTGRGIPADDLPRLFDRFFRSERARAEGEAGFGLGLAIAKSIVDGMNGTITVSSEMDRGTAFEITLPRGRF